MDAEAPARSSPAAATEIANRIDRKYIVLPLPFFRPERPSLLAHSRKWRTNLIFAISSVLLDRQKCDQLQHTIPYAARFPLRKCDGLAAPDVPVDGTDQLIGERHIPNSQNHLVIQFAAAVVHVGRTDDRPHAIDDEKLGVN